MKQNSINKIFPVLIFLFALSCQQQTEQNHFPKQEDDIPTDWFDVEEFWSNAKGYSYTVFFENSDTIRIEMDWSPNNDVYTKRIEIKDGETIIQQDMSFYPCGKIKSIRQKWDGLFSSLFGKYYSFDKTGKVRRVNDMEKSFPFTKDQVLSLLKEMNIELKHAYRFPNDPERSPIWHIICKDPTYPKDYSRYIDIDGQTGIILEDTIVKR